MAAILLPPPVLPAPVAGITQPAAPANPPTAEDVVTWYAYASRLAKLAGHGVGQNDISAASKFAMDLHQLLLGPPTWFVPAVTTAIGTAVTAAVTAVVGSKGAGAMAAAVGPIVKAMGPTMKAAVGPAVTAAVGPAVAAAVGPAVTAAMGPAVTAAMGPAVTAAMGP
eukprot:CAMPEP_0202892928 /NCGR_PEP_ID=MMETSP1392-20130828/2595_1 /ASSEMBLY_ACC=CAM_ASM_000868 /TAXON_ID=225041 /ORGANISM="Chlamydomonas chlamydogama, Strain SAG 11-48b" /LENGTH=166 /DNA_ID=CAMNT_0049577065 /DNA_START=134 /DNA_END=630 /DNA_ORIENTATION=-